MELVRTGKTLPNSENREKEEKVWNIHRFEQKGRFKGGLWASLSRNNPGITVNNGVIVLKPSRNPLGWWTFLPELPERGN